jgi:hypothetical protein
MHTKFRSERKSSVKEQTNGRANAVRFLIAPDYPSDQSFMFLYRRAALTAKPAVTAPSGIVATFSEQRRQYRDGK